MAYSKKINRILARNKYLLGLKSPWNSHFQLIGEYIMTRKQNFTSDGMPGDFLTDDLFDSTAPRANALMASILLGMLWGNGAKTFKMIKPHKLKLTDGVKQFYEKVTMIMENNLSHDESGLTLALNEYMLDEGSFGTAGIGVFENDSFPYLKIKAWDVKTMAIAEGANGCINTIHNTKEFTVRNLVQEYGYDNIGADNKKKFDDGNETEKVKVLHVIEERLERDPNKFGAKDMPIASIHIELKSGKILKESGYHEMPVLVARFYKAMGEVYGRSPGMFALPDIMEINAIWEALTLAIEKKLSPPLGVLSDGQLGGGDINTTAGAVNVFDISNHLNIDKPVFPLFTVGDMREVEYLIEKLEKAIEDAFSLDRLLDLNNEKTRMTAYETSARMKLRGDSLGTLFSRQELELFTPMLNRSFNILFRKGLFGVIAGSDEEQFILDNGGTPEYIPEEVANAIMSGEEVFEIQYVSPAKRIMQAEEVQSIMSTYEALTMIQPISPDVADGLNHDKALVKLHTLTGGDSTILNSIDRMKEIRETRAEAQAAERDLRHKEVLASIAQQGAQAEATLNPRSAKE